MTWSAPSDRTNSALRTLHTAVTSAPKYLASCTAEVPMLPDAPLMSTLWPGRTAALSRRKYRAVDGPSTSAAASSKPTLDGMISTEPDCAMQTYSALAPVPKPVKPNTLAPGMNRRTSLPTDTTLPASSRPSLRRRRRGRRTPRMSRPHSGRRRRIWHSAAVTVVACTLIRISSSAGSGLGRSTNSRTSGPPNLSKTATFICCRWHPRESTPARRGTIGPSGRRRVRGPAGAARASVAGPLPVSGSARPRSRP